MQLARSRLHATRYEMAIAMAAPAFGYLFVLIWAHQMEGKAKLPFVTFTWFFTRGFFLLTPFLVRGVHSREWYILMISLTPVVFSISTPAYTAIMEQIYPESYRGRLMSFVRIGAAAAMLITARVMGHLQERAGLDYRWMFAIGGVFGVGTALAFGRLKLPATKSVSPPLFREFLGDSLRVLRTNISYRRFCIGVFIAGIGNLIASTYYPIYQVDHFHITPIQISNIVVASSLASLISLPFWGWFMDRFGPLTTTFCAVLINCLTPFFYAFSPAIWWLIPAGAANGFALSGVDLGYINTNLLLAEPGRASQYQAIHSTLYGIRGTIAPLLAIYLLHQIHSRWIVAFSLCGCTLLAGAALQILARNTHRNLMQRGG